MTTATYTPADALAEARALRAKFESDSDAIRARTDMAWPAKRRKIRAAWSACRVEIAEVQERYKKAQAAVTHALRDRLVDCSHIDPDRLQSLLYSVQTVAASTNRAAQLETKMLRLLEQQDWDKDLALVIMTRMLAHASDVFANRFSRIDPERGALLREYVMRVSKRGGYLQELQADRQVFSLAIPHDVMAGR